MGGHISKLPVRPAGPGLGNFSNVLSGPLRCWPNSPPAFHDLKVMPWHCEIHSDQWRPANHAQRPAALLAQLAARLPRPECASPGQLPNSIAGQLPSSNQLSGAGSFTGVALADCCRAGGRCVCLCSAACQCVQTFRCFLFVCWQWSELFGRYDYRAQPGTCDGAGTCVRSL